MAELIPPWIKKHGGKGSQGILICFIRADTLLALLSGVESLLKPPALLTKKQKSLLFTPREKSRAHLKDH